MPDAMPGVRADAPAPGPSTGAGGARQPRASPAGRLLIALLRLYRATGRARVVPRCRFHPTCSAYALQAIRTHGAVRGVGLTVARLVRCHPFNAGGVDPVPPARK